MNFNNIDDQILLNETRLKDESERLIEIKSRIGFLSIAYTIFAAYSFQLTKFLVKSENAGVVYVILLFLFAILVVISVINSARLLTPVNIAHKDLPSFFYTDLKKQYIEIGIPEDQTDGYIKHTYNKQLEEAVAINFATNNRKSKFHYYAFLTALIAIIPYVMCIGIYLSNQKDDVVKVELTNKAFKDMSNQEKNNSNKANQRQKPVDTSKVIEKKPILIRENKSTESGKNSDKK